MKATSPTDWIGSLAVDKDGNQLGEIRSILNDDETQKPEWAVVSTGFLGADKPVPLAGARPEGDKVWANVTKDQVKSAPDVQDVTHLTPDEEVSLFDHYGVPYGGDTVTSTGDPTASGKGQSTGRMPLHEEELTAKKQNFNELMDTLVHGLVRGIPATHATLMIHDPATGAFVNHREETSLEEGSAVDSIRADSPVVQWLTATEGLLVKEEVKLWKRQVDAWPPLQRICHRICDGPRRYIPEISGTL